MTEFTRPHEGSRFAFGGLKTNVLPDALPPGKYALAQNIRATNDDSLVTRPGQSLITATTTNRRITDIRTYAALSTDNLPRVLMRDIDDKIWLNTSATATQVGDFSPFFGGLGAMMLPFRPNASPVPWMYITNGADYRKFSAPDVADVVMQAKVGIAEPQAPPDAGVTQELSSIIEGGDPGTDNTGAWVAGGTAGAGAFNTRTADTAGACFPDPSTFGFGWTSVQVSSTVQYQQGQYINLPYFTLAGVRIMDVFAPLPSPVSIQGIYYFSGTTGRCIIVPGSLGTPIGGASTSIYTQQFLTSIRRGAIIQVGAELCLVWSIAIGIDGTISIETSTVSAHTTADTLSSVPAIQVLGFVSAGMAITDTLVTYTVDAPIGTQTSSGTIFNPFVNAGQSIQAEDYISLGIYVYDPTLLIEMKFLIDVSDGTFTKDYYYYTVRPSDISAAIANSATQLANLQTLEQRALVDAEVGIAFNNQVQASTSAQTAPGPGQWSQITFPISALTRVGNDQTKSLQTVVKVQVLWNVSGHVIVSMSDMMVHGGSQPDVGDVGAPYLYRVRPRSKVTGVVGNPSPATRYGVSPRRQRVSLPMPSAAYDPQIDTWDVFRYGGSVTSWRYIGSTPTSFNYFIDNYADEAADAGDALDFDNFEPWPSVDVPNNGNTVLINGTIAIVTSTNPNITRYLPGTLVQFGTLSVYTLWTRPTPLGGNNYLLQFVENAGVATTYPYAIQEPALAHQPLPYLWGPDANGTVFACGDPLRPGTLYYSKPNSPDSAPDAFNTEITPPSEPLLGGEVLDGLSIVGSSERWWALYPLPSSLARYNVVQQPIPRGLAAPFGHCTDGVSILFWAKDGIWSSTKGSLTDADLFNLFPHDGIPGENVSYSGTTIYAPDYSRAGTFRLECANGFLYATYQDSGAVYRTLVMDMKRGAWSVDQYIPTVTAFCHPDQQAGTVLSSTIRYPMLLMGTSDGRVTLQTSGLNDLLGGGIACLVAVGEFDGGDARAPKQWGDGFLDVIPACANSLRATPMSLGTPAAPTTVFAVSAARVRRAVSVGGVVVSDFLGLQLAWVDDFTRQSTPTQLFLWQPSFVIQPARTLEWFTFGTAFGLDGYMHIREIAVAWVSTQPITITITSFDGQSPAPLVVPSSGGAYKKVMFPLTANKGQLFKFAASSTMEFQLFFDDFEVHVGAWRRQGAYASVRGFGGRVIDVSPI